MNTNLPQGWAWASFDEVAEIALDLVDPTPFPDAWHLAPNHIESKTGHLIERSTIATDRVFSPKHRFRAGQIVYSKIRPYLAKALMAQADGLCSADMYPITPRVNARYLLRWMLSSEFTQAASDNQGRTVLPKINKEALSRLPVPVPPLAEQDRISEKVEVLLARICRARDELERVPKLVERYRKAVLEAAFREAEALGRLAPVADFIQSLDQGWSPKCDNEVSNEDAWAVIKTTAIQALEFLPNENKRLPMHLLPRSNIEIKSGDVLITRAGPRSRVGICCVVEATRTKLMLCDKAYRLRVQPGVADPSYLAMMLNSPSALQRIEEMKTGINDSGLNLTQDKFLNLKLPLIPIEAQRESIEKVQTTFSHIARALKETAKAAQHIDRLNQAILNKAFSGELVPQDPSDEPASKLLERIKAAGAGASPSRGGRRPRASA